MCNQTSRVEWWQRSQQFSSTIIASHNMAVSRKGAFTDSYVCLQFDCNSPSIDGFMCVPKWNCHMKVQWLHMWHKGLMTIVLKTERFDMNFASSFYFVLRFCKICLLFDCMYVKSRWHSVSAIIFDDVVSFAIECASCAISIVFWVCVSQINFPASHVIWALTLNKCDVRSSERKRTNVNGKLETIILLLLECETRNDTTI